MSSLLPKKIYVLDCGGQYCHLIASRLRKHEALSVIVPCDEPLATFADAGAIIVSGGPQSVFDPASMRARCRAGVVGRFRGIARAFRLRDFETREVTRRALCANTF